MSSRSRKVFAQRRLGALAIHLKVLLHREPDVRGTVFDLPKLAKLKQTFPSLWSG